MYSQPGYGQAGYAPPGYGGPEELYEAGRELIGMRPWVMICGICGIIGASFNLVQVLAMFARGGRDMSEAVGNFIGVVVSLVLASLLLKFGGAINAFRQVQSPQQLEAALEAHLAYWRLLGILFIIAFLLLLVIFVIGVAIAITR